MRLPKSLFNPGPAPATPDDAAAPAATPGGPPPPSADYGAMARVGYTVIAFTFLGLSGWAALARVDSAVIAPGVVAVESKRQVVQHLEGGIVAEILVREGEEVAKDQVLFRLDPTQPKASDDAALAQLRAALALEARLVAERDEKDQITFPEELLANARLAVVRDAMADQLTQFRDRRAAFRSQTGILESRAEQSGHEIEGLTQERLSAEQQLVFIDDELDAVRQLEQKRLVNKSRVSGLEREKARLEGLVGRNVADTAKVRGAIGELNMQISQLRQQRAEDIGKQLLDVRQKLAEMSEKVRVTRNVLGRIDIRAPRGGMVQNINARVYTVGAVARAGDTLLEIVPLDEPLVVDAQVPVQDIDRLKRNDTVEVRFPSFHDRSTPTVMGRLKSVSRDRLVDETTHQPYFLARVAVADTDIPAALKQRLVPGMNAEVAFYVGERSVLSYLVRPVTDALSRAFTER
ncbi:HlyD family type I secretion periplasmic adaptor subunit [Xanthobacter autotrophicus]|uniref:HlyD family type I secretion periplasmic adaptor subunit n=1 Tax=Xanthobacter TaxID=279 RepID=UPI0024AB9DC3|nr:HlyD family type I secretion periplasmic adaptor subunit [Xanthobacter autotrophicus]MDI4663095.1 HlyD family type I secretion periplasmic adaptor subunit [Xanthobacter autotrophicus]